MSGILEVRELTIRFGGLTAVSSLSFSVPRKSIFGMIGPNGSGKTTVLNMITGVYPPASGTIILDGEPIQGLRPHRICKLGISRTFQNLRLFNNLTVLENVLIGRHCRLNGGIPRDVFGFRSRKNVESSALSVAMEYLEMFNLGPHRDSRASSLPYGLKRELEIVRALATEPSLLLLDEPAAGMNSEETGNLIELIRQVRDRGVTVLLIEHNIRMVMGLCDAIVVLDSGSKIAEGQPEEIQNDPRVIEAYLGTRGVKNARR